MELQLIRNATMKLSYGGYQILTDPCLGAKHSIQSFAKISPNPLVDLPCSPEEVVAGTEMVLLSHLHIDHFDPPAEELLAKDIPMYCQPDDETTLAEKGFTQVTPIVEAVTWQGVSLTRTPGQHGTGEWIKRMGHVSGFIFKADGEPTVYWAGDTIWYGPVEQIIADTQPDLIITHSSGAKFGGSYCDGCRPNHRRVSGGTASHGYCYPSGNAGSRHRLPIRFTDFGRGRRDCG